MATITIHNVPDELVDRIKWLADQKGVSMEQEIRDLLQSRYEQRSATIESIRQRWETLPLQSSDKLTLRAIAVMPLEARHQILAQSISATADDFLNIPELTEFSVLDTADWELECD
jgi:antitoxin FitA